MKKRFVKIAILILTIVIIGSYFLTSNASSITYYNGNGIMLANPEQIEIISTEVKIDTINSSIENVYIIRNMSNKTREESISIPIKEDILETKIKDLKIVVNSVQVEYKKENDNYTFTAKFKPNEAKKIIITYNTENDLQKSKVIKYSFENLNIGTGIIKKAKVDIILPERDIPLVTKIHPGHYTFKNNIITVEYYNFKVNSITREIVIEKETYDDLLYGRESNVSEMSRKIIECVPTWEKQGIPINYETDFRYYDYNNSYSMEIEEIFKRITGIEVKYEEYGNSDYIISSNIVRYYTLKKLIKENKINYINSSITSTYRQNLLIHRQNLLIDYILFENCPKDDLPLLNKLVCVDYVTTMGNEELYVDKNITPERECNIVEELTKKDELSILTTELYGLATGPETGARVIFLGKDIQATDKEKVEYVNMINASMYIRTKMYNKKIDEKINGVPIGYNGKENIEIAKKFLGEPNIFFESAEYTKEEYYDKMLEEDSNDYALLNSEVPTVIQYIGYIVEENDKKVVKYNWEGFYNYGGRGLATTSDVLNTNRAKELLKASKSKNEKTKQEIETEISNLKIEKDTKVETKIETNNTVNETSVETEVIENKNESFIKNIKIDLNTIILISIGIIAILILICIIILIIRRKK